MIGTRRLRHVATLLASGAGLWAVGCISERATATGPGNGSGECRVAVGGPIVGTTQALIAIRNYGFHPDTIRVKAGAKVTWLNCEDAGFDAHTSTSETGRWQSTYIGPGESFTRTFNDVGAFPFFCEPHPFMRGVVLVEQ